MKLPRSTMALILWYGVLLVFKVTAMTPEEDAIHQVLVQDMRVKSIGSPDPRVGQKVDEWRLEESHSPQELGTYYEGDILIPDIYSDEHEKNAIVGTQYRWPGGVVPFELTDKLTRNGRAMVERSMRAFHTYTCIRFVPRTDQKDFLRIENENTGCWSAVGRLGGMQKVNLQEPGCVTMLGTPVHELLHTLGFYHEHSRQDRDDYVIIHWENILDGFASAFRKLKTTDFFNVSYDYNSIMHYSEDVFSKNQIPTITAKRLGVTVGQRMGFSRGDIAKVRCMYCDNCLR